MSKTISQIEKKIRNYRVPVKASTGMKTATTIGIVLGAGALITSAVMNVIHLKNHHRKEYDRELAQIRRRLDVFDDLNIEDTISEIQDALKEGTKKVAQKAKK